ncbi:MAG: hypothetical protein N0C91_19645 [Candidatus Thiodiazotropha endolucinida]|nr:hypothetical protein [Candidatus Thiodiazotropha taylori]MCW4238052.1 hypothetical protein [Candidatus Thiodiazotropha endolucinida]MCW4289915.1 hypothetical protein [Candidatus Thiodiazotropha endolucinida]MCW4296932.1 hypothetical protein [Candidatus Thiodiazotropha endolucinida]
MSHPFSGQKVAILLNESVTPADYMFVGRLVQAGWRGAYYVTECYAAEREAVESGGLTASAMVRVGDLCLERAAVALMMRADAGFYGELAPDDEG